MGLFEHAQTIDDIRQLKLKGAMYIRMSTDLQIESPENQARQIRAYAEKYGIEIVREYTDRGISGMSADKRERFLEMLEDVKNGRHNYNIILYLDDSRWGRFIGGMKGIYYREILHENKVLCQSCERDLKITRDLTDNLITVISDFSASEFIQNLSKKVFVGQANLASKGYRQGGPAGFGLRRALLDDQGKFKQELKMGERKSLQTERVILVPGPKDEQDVVKWIFEQVGIHHRSEWEIAEILNERGCKTDFGHSWSSQTIKNILKNEKYIGNNVFNRFSSKLKSARRANPPEEWIRKDGAFEAVVDKELFNIVQAILRERHNRVSNEEMLDKLKLLYVQKGWLSALVIDETEGMPPSSLYSSRFGGLLRAYQMIGYEPNRDYRYVEINRILRQMHGDVVADTIQNIERLSGRQTMADPDTGLLEINYNLTASIVISRCFKTSGGSHRWKIRFDTGLHPDMTIAVRMDSSNQNIYDYYILPYLEFGDNKLRLAEENPGLLDSFRFESLDYFWNMSVNVDIDEVA